MANNIAITPGSGAEVCTDQITSDSSHAQVIKIAYSAAGVRTLAQVDVNGVGVQVLAVASGVTFPVVNNGSAALKVDGSAVTQPVSAASALPVSAAVGSPVAVRVSNGSAFVDTIPVSIAAAVTVAGTVAVSGTVAVTQSGSWTIAAVTSITNTVTVAGTVAISGTVTVSGTVTANQGTAAVIGNAWYAKITDGTNPVGVSTVGAVYALKVDVVQQVGGGVSQADQSTFTNATTYLDTIGGVFNDSITPVGSGKAGAVRITSYRAFHVNLRDNLGNELAGTAAPLRVDPVGTTTQPVSGTVTADQGATAWVCNITEIAGTAVVAAAAGVLQVGIVDGAGTAFAPAAGITEAVALPVKSQPSITGMWRVHFSYTASATDQAIHTPAGGKTAFIEGLIITPTAAGALLEITDGAVASALFFYYGQPPLGAIVITPDRPMALSAIGNVLRWSTGAAATGDVVAWGYDA